MADDIDFKHAMRDVRPLKKGAAPAAPDRRPRNHALRAQIQTRAIQSAAQINEVNGGQASEVHQGHCNEEGDNSLFFLRSGVQKKVLRELKKGSRYRIISSLDLHGLTRHQAQQEIGMAVHHLEPGKLSCLLIIHGKGLHSTSGAALKGFTATYLKTLPTVRAYCSAQQHDGGDGALYVLVRG